MHILGDFYFQTEKTAKEKSEKIGAVIKHSVVYGIVTIVPCSMFVNGKILLVAVALSIAHGLVDIVKYFAVKPKRNRETRIFILDQILHVACIILAAFALHFVTGDVDLPQLVYEVTSVIGISFFDLVRWTALILFACKPSGILIQSLINNFKPEIATTHEEIKKRREDNRIFRTAHYYHSHGHESVCCHRPCDYGKIHYQIRTTLNRKSLCGILPSGYLVKFVNSH